MFFVEEYLVTFRGECYSLFMCGFLGLSESQSEVSDPIVFPVFEVEKWEEET